MAGIRYPGTAFHHGFLKFGNLSTGWGTLIMAPIGDFVASALDQSRAYIAPGRYSEVRKVVFSITFKHEQNGLTLGTTVSARVAPSSVVASDRVTLETVVHAKGSRITTQGVGTVWSNQGPTHEPAFYDTNGSENAIVPTPVVNPNTTVADSQMVFVEFDRDDDGSDDFFADWDAAALIGEDAYIAYTPAIQRNDAIPWNIGDTGSPNFPPAIIGFGVAVIQAPTIVNNSCTTLPATNGQHVDSSIATVFSQRNIANFLFRESEWDGLDSINLYFRQAGRLAPILVGEFTVRVTSLANDQSDGEADVVYEESFAPQQNAVPVFSFRTADFKDLLVDNTIYAVDFRSDTGLSNQNLPWGWWEIIQKDFSRKTTFHPAGMGNPLTAATTLSWPTVPFDWFMSSDESLFDPEWYAFIPETSLLVSRWYGNFDHLGADQIRHTVEVNANLAVAMQDFDASGSDPVIGEVRGTPHEDANEWRIQFQIVRDLDPINKAGKRKMKLRLRFLDISGLHKIGAAGYSYAYLVPNSEFPEQGPVFDVGAFDPEGCASTAAGLGDNPGILVMTNGGTIPKKFNPTSGVIENAGIDTPFRGQQPVPTTASSQPSGMAPGIYTYRYTLRNSCTGKESDPNPEDLVVDSTTDLTPVRITLTFTGVVIPVDAQVDQICVYRTLAGGDFPVMAKVGCFDIPSVTVFVDSVADADLDFIADSLSLLNAPMPCVTSVEEFRNRLWGLGDIPNLNPPGTVAVVNGSTTIVGDTDTDFDRCIIGRFIQIQGDCTAYEVVELVPTADLVSPSNGFELIVDREYEGITDIDLRYTICGHPNRLYMSEPLEPECWPALNFLDVDPGDGDRLIGAVSNFNRLVICKRRKTYHVAFRETPITEIIVPTLISRDIGSISPRSFAQVASGSVWLSDRGLALYDGRGVSAVPESSVMNDLFVNPDNPNYLRRDVNGRAIGAEGVYYPRREQYLLLLPTVKTTRGASLVLVWDTELRNVTLLEFCQEFLSIEVARDADGNERVYLGDTNGFVWIWDVGDTDGIGFPNATGTVRGTVTAAGIDSLTGASFLEDSTASFIIGGIPGLGDLSGLPGLSGLTGFSNMGMAGACIFWRAAGAPLDTPWQSRFIYTSNATRMFVTPNWGPDTPSVGDEYMLGPIQFLAEFKPANYGTDDFPKRDWRQVVVHEPEAVSTELRTELLRDFQSSDADEDTVLDAVGTAGLGRTFDLGFGQGRQTRPVGRLVHQFMGVRLSNFAPEEPLTLINHLLMLNPKQSR